MGKLATIQEMRSRRWNVIRNQGARCSRCGDAGWMTALLRARPSCEYTFRCSCPAGDSQPLGFPVWSSGCETTYRRITAAEMQTIGVRAIARGLVAGKVVQLTITPTGADRAAGFDTD